MDDVCSLGGEHAIISKATAIANDICDERS